MSLELPRGVRNLFQDLSREGFGDKYNLLGKKDGKELVLEKRHAKGIRSIESAFINDTDRLNAAEYLTRIFVDYAGYIEGDKSLNKDKILENLDILRSRMTNNKGSRIASKMEEAFVAVMGPVVPKETLEVFQDFSQAPFSSANVVYGEKTVRETYKLKYAERGTFRARLIADHERLQASEFIRKAAVKHAQYFKDHDYQLVEGRLVNRFNMVKNLEKMRFQMMSATKNEKHKAAIDQNMRVAINLLKPEVAKAEVFEQDTPLGAKAQAFIHRLEAAETFSPKTDPKESLGDLRKVFTAIMNNHAQFTKPKKLASNLSAIRVVLVMREEALLARLSKDPRANASQINKVIDRIAAINFAINQMTSKLEVLSGKDFPDAMSEEERRKIALEAITS